MLSLNFISPFHKNTYFFNKLLKKFFFFLSKIDYSIIQFLKILILTKDFIYSKLKEVVYVFN